MKSLTVSLDERELEALQSLAQTLDPSGSVKVASIGKACMMEGLVRAAKRVNSDLAMIWLTTEVMKRSLSAVAPK